MLLSPRFSEAKTLREVSNGLEASSDASFVDCKESKTMSSFLIIVVLLDST